MKKKFGNSVASIEIEATKKAVAPSLLDQAADATIQKKAEDETTKLAAEPGIKLADLPLLSILPRKHLDTVRDAFEELELLTYCLDDNGNQIKREERIKQIKTQIETIQHYAKVSGFRHGQFAFRSKEMEGKKSLKVDLLMENGVTAQQIRDSTIKGDGYTEMRFQKISEKD